MKGKVTIHESVAGMLTIEYRGRQLKYQEIAAAPVQARPAKKPVQTVHYGHTPAPDHWNRSYRCMQPYGRAAPTRLFQVPAVAPP